MQGRSSLGTSLFPLLHRSMEGGIPGWSPRWTMLPGRTHQMCIRRGTSSILRTARVATATERAIETASAGKLNLERTTSFPNDGLHY